MKRRNQPYEPDSSAHDNSAGALNGSTKRRKKKRCLEWKLIGSYDTKEEAVEIMNGYGTHWAIKYTTEPKKFGKQVTYKCGVPKRGEQECGANMRVTEPPDNTEFVLYESASPHTCTPRTGLTADLKTEVARLQKNCTPTHIIFNTVCRPANVKKSQLYGLLGRNRKKEHMPSTFAGLSEWCETQPEVPASQHKIFVVDHFMDPETRVIRIFVSTPNLLRQVAKGDIIHGDATYKTNWQGLPVLVVGSTDRTRKFILGGLILSSRESEEDYEFVFKSMVAFYQKHSINWAFKYCMSDCAMAMRNAAKSVFGADIVPLDCWAHVKRAAEKKAVTLLGKYKSAGALADMQFLQLAWSKDVFDKALKLFWKKYKAEKAFTTYFKKVWVRQYSNWFEGAAPSRASTNNALEAFNKVVKDKVTGRCKLALGVFVGKLSEQMKFWSMDTVFSDEYTIPHQMWQQAWRWAKSEVQCVDDGDSSFYPAKGSELPKKKISYTKWESFSDYVDTFQLVKVSHVDRPYKEMQCNCYDFQKQYMCRHVLGIAVLNKEVRVHPQDRVDGSEIEQKPRLGRPPKVKPGLVRE